jgi:cyanophycinase
VSRQLTAILLLACWLPACSTVPIAPAAAPELRSSQVAPGYTVFGSGSSVDAVTTPLGGALLAGGGTDSDDGMRWLLAQGGTQRGNSYGDVVVLRTRGSDGYNTYLMKLGAHSVTSIVITSIDGANSTYVRDAIAKAEVVFLAGGDQSTYVKLWTGTMLQAAVNARIASGYPIGGTSAGLAVMGEYAYSSLNASSTSAALLANPYDSSATFARALFTVPLLKNVITDSHFVVRNRLGRSVAFLARLQQDGWAAAPRGIAIDEGSALGVTATGAGTVFGKGAGVYFLRVGAPATRTCVANTSLSFAPVIAHHVPVGKQFSVSAWTTGDAVPYTLSATSGMLTSSSGSIY